MRLFVSILALAAATSAVHAADLIVNAPATAAPASASGLTGYVDVSAQHVTWFNTDDDDGNAFGGAGEFGLWYGADTFRFGVDGYVDYLAGQAGENDVPEGVRVFGAHAGLGVDNFYAGLFGSVGWAPDDSNEEYLPGFAGGVEGTYTNGNSILFGHLGYANVRIDGDRDGFTGVFGDFGVAFDLTDDVAVMVKGSAGYAPRNYSYDTDDYNGLYAAAEIKGIYMLPTEFPLALTASYELATFNAIYEEDFGITSTVKIGLSIPFGAETPKDALHVLSTPNLPYRAAAWGDKLD